MPHASPTLAGPAMPAHSAQPHTAPLEELRGSSGPPRDTRPRPAQATEATPLCASTRRCLLIELVADELSPSPPPLPPPRDYLFPSPSVVFPCVTGARHSLPKPTDDLHDCLRTRSGVSRPCYGYIQSPCTRVRILIHEPMRRQEATERTACPITL